ncbi:hypothetical protein [Kutzneria chonburiensis]|uniref:Uncharacterized protein n=1 Tax=Kutzneria chonburiensis TaxID=1483604 RepID=A0ABV6MSS9_9PSEU|nr:hypothetical protein [Kutzneria chonburiensis]
MATDANEPVSLGRIRVIRLWLVLPSWLLLVTIIAALSGLLGDASTPTAIGAAVALAVCLFFHVFYASYAPTRLPRRRTERGGSVNLTSIRKEYTHTTEQFTEAQIVQYAKTILKPRKLRGRIIEEITPLRRTLRQKVQTILEVPADNTGDALLFPLLMPVKGELQDDLSISVDGETAATLTHREYLLLTSVVLDALLVPAVGALTHGETAELEKLVDTAVKLVARRSRPTTRAHVKKIKKCARRLKRLAPTCGDSFRIAAILLRKLATHYAIVVIVPTSTTKTNRCVVTYERFFIPKLRLAGLRHPLRFAHDRIGLLFGARPVHLSLAIDNAASANSYHLFVMGPEGMYVGWQNIDDPDGIFTSTTKSEDLSQPYGRLQRRRGQRYLHLYMRSIPERLAGKLHLDVRFYEVPPGSLAGATLAAAASFVLIYVVALVLPYTVDGQGLHPLGSDFPALVLAFPALAGALVGFESRSTGLLGGSLSSKTSAFLTVLVSLGASGLYMAQQTTAMRAATSYELPWLRDVIGVHGLLWQVLVTLGLVNTLYASYTWLCRTATFRWLAERPGDDKLTGSSEL